VSSRSRPGFDRRPLARDDDLSRCVAVRDDEGAVLGRRAQQLGKLRVVEPDERCHGAISALPRRLHQLAAPAHEADPVVQR
jgi:hypothetical protein